MNSVELFGRVSTEPHFGTTETGRKFCSIILEVPKYASERSKVLVPVVFIGEKAEIAARSLRQYMHIGVVGAIDMNAFGGELKLTVIGKQICLGESRTIYIDEKNVSSILKKVIDKHE